MYLNKALIIGNLTRDPEVRSLPSGQKVCSFSVATERVWNDKSGAKQQASEYHNIVVFGRQAETCAQYLKKGQSVLIEGRIQTRSWESQDGGGKKYKTEIVADRVQFGPKRDGGARSGAYGAAKNEPSDAAADSSEKGSEEINYPTEEVNPEDIPF
ncbi:MAG: single-stranded DNA-binding protein [Candidatus Paceibacterota bacterium]|jgi:single-strand DNA-binding protein